MTWLRGALSAVLLHLAAAGSQGQELVVLGIAQDAGIPQLGCVKECCAAATEDPTLARDVASVAIVSGESRWLIDATPDIRSQLALLDRLAPTGRDSRSPGLDGIFLTHAHMGHYTGLMHLGRESMAPRGVPVHALPRMADYLRENGPWSQLVELENIVLHALGPNAPVHLGEGLSIRALPVPHRDEFSETAAYLIEGPRRSALFVPDIDKWELWERGFVETLAEVDVALVDGTFFDASELPGRAMEEIPHPLIVETLGLLRGLPMAERSKVHFVHLNHSNPALDSDSPQHRRITEMGCGVVAAGQRFGL